MLRPSRIRPRFRYEKSAISGDLMMMINRRRSQLQLDCATAKNNSIHLSKNLQIENWKIKNSDLAACIILPCRSIIWEIRKRKVANFTRLWIACLMPTPRANSHKSNRCKKWRLVITPILVNLISIGQSKVSFRQLVHFHEHKISILIIILIVLLKLCLKFRRRTR